MTRDGLIDIIDKEYGIQPEYLWARTPSNAIFRNRENGKWFAILMQVKWVYLGEDIEGTADIVNVKCDPSVIGSLRQERGYYPAYHMNKDSWISVVIDQTTEIETVKNLLEFSRSLTLQCVKKKGNRTI